MNGWASIVGTGVYWTIQVAGTAVVVTGLWLAARTMRRVVADVVRVERERWATPPKADPPPVPAVVAPPKRAGQPFGDEP